MTYFVTGATGFLGKLPSIGQAGITARVVDVFNTQGNCGPVGPVAT